jgi:hypothetical protein
MKLKLSPLYILSFLSLTFFVHEIHDWAHTLVARLVSGCWGPRVFDGWELCADNRIAVGLRVLAVVAGPLVNFILLWVAWQKMDKYNSSMQEQSWGVTLVFAALPLNNLLAAVSGGGDLTSAIRLTFRHADAFGHHFVALVGLLIMLIICVPPLVRAFICLPWWQGKLFYYPVFLIVPGMLDHWLVKGLLNKWLIKPDTPEDKAYWWAIAWTLFTMTIWLLTHKKISQLITDEELPL